MDNNEIVTNDEVNETTEEIVSSESNNAVKIAAIVGAVGLISAVAYKFVVKPIIAKVKAKKQDNVTEADFSGSSSNDDEDESVEDN